MDELFQHNSVRQKVREVKQVGKDTAQNRYEEAAAKDRGILPVRT